MRLFCDLLLHLGFGSSYPARQQIAPRKNTQTLIFALAIKIDARMTKQLLSLSMIALRVTASTRRESRTDNQNCHPGGRQPLKHRFQAIEIPATMQKRIGSAAWC